MRLKPSAAPRPRPRAATSATPPASAALGAERAHQVPREYLRAARQADQQYSAAGTNPILDRLRSRFGLVRETRGKPGQYK